jgi:hypothetical protein
MDAAIFDLREHFEERFAWWQANRLTIADDMAAHFFMPFPTVIVRHATGATLIHRRVSEIGLESTTFVAAECMLIESDPRSCIIVSMHPEMRYRGPATYQIDVMADSAVAVTLGRVVTIYRDETLADMLLDIGNFRRLQGGGPLGKNVSPLVMNFTTTLDDMWWALQPANWIVKKSPEIAHRIQRGAQIPAHLRERFIVMSQKAMERTFRLPNPENAGRTLKVGHRRRACWHTLKHERWGERIGQRIHVQGCWVGPEEVVVGGERYRVLLDSPGYNPNDLPELPPDAVQI